MSSSVARVVSDMQSGLSCAIYWAPPGLTAPVPWPDTFKMVLLRSPHKNPHTPRVGMGWSLRIPRTLPTFDYILDSELSLKKVTSVKLSLQVGLHTLITLHVLAMGTFGGG